MCAGWCSRWAVQVGVCRVVQQVGCASGGRGGGSGCAGGCVHGGAASGVCRWWKRRNFSFPFLFFFFFPNVAQKIIASVVFNDTPLLITRLITSLELSLFLKKARTNFPFYCFVSCNENVVFGIMTWCWI